MMKNVPASPTLVKRPARRGIDPGKKMFLMILPFLALAFVFSYFPLYGWVYAFFDYKPPLSLAQCDFVGLKWFSMLFRNATQIKQLMKVMEILLR